MLSLKPFYWPALLYLAVLSLASPPLLYAESILPPFSLRAWTQRDGLPSNEIISLSQGRDGFLYVGTTEGLVRFDGKNFTAVVSQDANAPITQDRSFVALTKAPAGDGLLIAPKSGGVIQLSDDTLTQQPLPPGLARSPAETLFRENDQTFWTGFKGGIALRQEGENYKVFDERDGLSASDRVQFARDGSGRVWLASGSFLARYEEGKLVRVSVGLGQERLRITSSKQDGPWIAADEHLLKFKDGAVVHIDKVNTSTGAHFLQALLEDSTGALWLGTRSRGLRRWTPNGETTRVIQVPEDISALIEDDQGNIWAGSNGSGLIRVSPGVLGILNRGIGLMENYSLSVCQDPAGRIWFANRDGGIASLNDSNRANTLSRPPKWENFSALSVVPAKGGRVWVSTPYGLLFIGGTGIQKQIDSENFTGENAPRVMFAARNGDLWIAFTAGGIARVRDDELKLFGPAEGTGSARVRTFAEDTSGSIWIGSEDGSLHSLQGERFVQQHPGLLQNTGAVQAIYFDHAGVCWIGTEQGGLARIDERGTRLLTTRDGLLSDNIAQITSDDAGELWIGSATGISRIANSEITHFIEGQLFRLEPAAIGIDQGLAEATCLSTHQPALWKTGEGLILFTTRQGIVAIDPAKERATRTSLRTKTRSLVVDGRREESPRIARIPPRARQVEIQYSTICLTTPERVHARYRLTGLDDNWTPATKDGVAKFTRLPPGRYTFEISAVIAGQPLSVSTDHLEVVVEAAWWENVWFAMGLVALAIVILVAAVRHWSHRRLHRKLAVLERDAALEQERSRIAKNIHDDLGAGLTRISLLTQSAQKNEGEAQLDKIYRTVSELTQSMDEIVWAVNPKNDDLESVANYIVEFAQGYLSDAGLRCRVLLPEMLPHRVLTAQFRHHLFLTCKEALNNIVKHARASDVVIEIDVRGDDLTLTITDNGVGLLVTTGTPSHRNGLKNMQSRMESIGGRLEISAAEPRGTVIALTAPLSQSLHTP
ncbi:MAG: two-component regulator propeller domain-containing protein [Nibricoccus sp.]